MRFWTPWTTAGLIGWCFIGTLRAAGEEKPLRAAAGQEYLWLLRTGPAAVGQTAPGGDRFVIHYRTPRTPAQTVYRAIRGTGRPVALSAYGPAAFVIYTDLTVQEVVHRPTQPPTPEPWEVNQLPPIKHDGELTGWTAGRSGPVALLRERSDEPALRLIALRKGEWQTLPPPPIPPDRAHGLVMIDPQADTLAAIETDDAGRTIVHRLEGDAWRAETYALRSTRRAVFVSVQRNLFMVQPVEGAERLVETRLLRGGDAVLIGSTTIPPLALDWDALGQAGSVTVVAASEGVGPAQSATPVLAWASFDVHRADDAQPLFRPVTEAEGPLLMQDPLTLVTVVIVAATMLFLLGSAQRRRRAQGPKLPPTLAPAAAPRLAALLIDALPPAAACMAIFGIANPVDLFSRHWIGAAMEFDQSLPGLAFIGLYVAHTTLTELFTAATLGKLLTGCRVVNLTGGPPHLWQVLARNLFKFVEFYAPILMILPLLSTHYQRLGDLVASTVVVTRSPAPPATQDPSNPQAPS